MKDGGPAQEMTLRDYFAGKALQGDLSALQVDGRKFDLLVKIADIDKIRISLVIAREAYEQADAMLEAREQQTGG